jgi:PadR family transcriptional regulator, regulatory protein PadR
MSRRTAFSAQTLAVLAALAARPSDWRHGYDLARETGLKSGTLHPILVAFAADHPRPLRPVRSWAAGLFVRS